MNAGGYYKDGQVLLNYHRLIKNPQELRPTIYHEQIHWAHLEGPAAYRDAFRQHFEARTRGEAIRQLPLYKSGILGLKDDWYDAYAGRVYDGHQHGHMGMEVPTKYIEWLAMNPKAMSALWNKSEFRETMLIVLRGLF